MSVQYHQRWFILLLGLVAIFTATMAPTAFSSDNTIKQILDGFDEDINLGMMVQNVKSPLASGDCPLCQRGRQPETIFYQRNPTRYFAPASSQKLLTAYAALNQLGPNFRYQTQLVIDPQKIREGIYQDNVYLRFSGDPLLTTANLNTLLLKLHEAGVNTIQGQFIIDDTTFDQDFWPPGANGEKQYSCTDAPLSAIIIDHNCENNIAIRKPRLHSSKIITDLLAKNQLQVTQGITIGRVPSKARPWLIHYSEPLSEMLVVMLKNSDPLIANALFKTLGSRVSRGQGNWKNGSKALQTILAKNLKIRFLDSALRDGAGVSQYTQITPYQLSVLLAKAYSLPAFVNALPLATIQDSNQGKPVRAMTAHENSTLGLAGYVQTHSQHTLAVVILMNGVIGAAEKYQGLQDKICVALAES